MQQNAWHCVNFFESRIRQLYKLTRFHLGDLLEVSVFVDDFVVAEGQDVYRLEILYLA